MNICDVIILDESGSMSAIYNQALAGINEVLSGIRKTQEDFPDQHHYVTIVTFEGSGMAGIKTRRDLDARGCHIQSIAQRIHQMVNAFSPDTASLFLREIQSGLRLRRALAQNVSS